MKILYNLLQGLLDTEDFLAEEIIARFTCPGCFHAGIHNHMINALMSKANCFRLFGYNLEVLGKGSFPL